jgi:hypothetical protein
MSAMLATKSILGRIPRLRQWHAIWFLWGILLGWVIWGPHTQSRTSASTNQGAENAFTGFANAALRRNWEACDLLTPTAAGQFMQALGATPVGAAPTGARAEALCVDRLRHVSPKRITAFIPHDRAGHLYDGVSQGDDLTRTTITFGRYCDAPADGPVRMADHRLHPGAEVSMSPEARWTARAISG